MGCGASSAQGAKTPSFVPPARSSKADEADATPKAAAAASAAPAKPAAPASAPIVPPAPAAAPPEKDAKAADEDMLNATGAIADLEGQQKLFNEPEDAPIEKQPAASGAPQGVDCGRAMQLARQESSKSKISVEEFTIQAVKGKLQREWAPEYMPEELRPPQDSPDTISERNTYVTLKQILDADAQPQRKTKIICTMGPSCWSEETLGCLLDAGLNIARLNFSHGSHDGHFEVLDRFRKVCASRGVYRAALLDTKGPEIRTAMLRDHQPIELEAGQDIIVEAVGEKYTEFEGYKDDSGTRIGLSYAKLCQSVSPGNTILMADGTISIEVQEVLSDTELRGKVLNSKKLGERKNCNLPGVKVDLPVLTEKDIDDLQNFGCKHHVDFVAASFVQSGEDVRFIRRVLDEAGGQGIGIISKIENMAGLENFDDILKETDGVMVARGDLGMEIPSEKVPVAQKMIITKCNIAGKPVVCATQMLESMISNPLPTRAEMTDVANAVYDGVDAVMLSGETANGSFPAITVGTMAAIVAHAEVGVDYYSQYTFIRYWTTNGGQQMLPDSEAVLSSASNMSTLFYEDTTPNAEKMRAKAPNPGCIVVMTQTGEASRLLSKYRPPAVVLVASSNDKVLRQTNVSFGQLPMPLPSDEATTDEQLINMAKNLLASIGAETPAGMKAVIVRGADGGAAEVKPCVKALRMVGGMSKALKSVGAALTLPTGTPIRRPGTQSLRCTRADLQLISQPLSRPRHTHILCTMGPKCWDEDSLGQLLDAGMDIARLNFSHGSHEAHLEVLQRYRKVCQDKAQGAGAATALWGVLLDTKGPEIRTAMLRDHKPIELEEGQDIIVEAVGDKYTEFEGYKDDSGTRIGLSYAQLCQSVYVGHRILLSDGTISIEVQEILSPTELRGKVLNSKSLGERKNCNLPGVKVDLPVLTDKDIDDLQNFGCKHKVDYIAASFVQSADDVRFIRKTLDDAGGHDIRIISKIENGEGLINFDEILKETDGVMVARGDLGMEIPAEKVPLAQKMMITKCNIAGKFVVCATQMLESMISNPRPTRAEMTDVANAVIDGVDCVMLSGETANGAFPPAAVATMAAICQNAEQLVDSRKRFNFIRNQTPKPICGAEAVCSSAVMTALDIEAKAILCITQTGRGSQLLSKYKPDVPVFVVTPHEQIIRHCRSSFGQLGVAMQHDGMEVTEIVDKAVALINQSGRLSIGKGDQLVIVHRRADSQYEDQRLTMRTHVIGGQGGLDVVATAYAGPRTLFWRSTKIGLDTILDVEKYQHHVRKTKIVCTMGPSCWDEQTLGKLLDAGMNVMRLNFSHGSHEGHYEVLDRFRQVCAAKGSRAAALLDTKGPEIRTAMLRDHKPIQLEAGQDIIVEAVGEKYTEFEGYKDDSGTRIGLSYTKLCQSVKPGNHILMADGNISIEVVEILDETTLKGRCLNSKTLGERKNCNLPGVKVDLPVLMDKDVNDLQNFACKHQVDFVAASFVQSADDVRFIRKVLDEAGGTEVKIISKIENAEALINFDDILKETDGVMVARGDLGMEIPVEKVPIAQKMMITKANISGKFVICATQMLESMAANPHPTRAEMTDVANAVFDGADGVMLSGETANGSFPVQAVRTMARIAGSAELGVNYYQVFDYIRNFTPKPVGTLEAVASCVAKNAVDVRPGMIVVFSEFGKTARLISKYRPTCPVLVVTSKPQLARQCSALFSVYTMLLDSALSSPEELPAAVCKALEYGVANDICAAGREVLVLTSNLVAIDSQQGNDRHLFVTIAPGQLQYSRLGSLMPFRESADEKWVAKTVSMRSTVIELGMLTTRSSGVRKTKIVATLGPSCADAAVMERMVRGGLDVARINLQHGSAAENGELLRRYREVCEQQGRPACLLLDLSGHQFRTSFLLDKPSGARVRSIQLERGEAVTLVMHSPDQGLTPEAFVGWKCPEQGARIAVHHPSLPQLLPGQEVIIQDGHVVLRVEKKLSDTEVQAVSVHTTTLQEYKSVHLPNEIQLASGLSAKDRADLAALACNNAVEFVAAARVEQASDIEAVREVLDNNNSSDVKIIAKVESGAGLKHLEEIIEVADGIMVARGDLGSDITPEKVALAQGVAITKTNLAGKVVITARQMLDSMVSNPRPTRAEMTDVANAVIDGTDCVMLSGETANGAFPSEAVTTMAAICQNAEQATNYHSVHTFIRDFSAKPSTTVEATAAGLAKACVDTHAALCVVISDRAYIADLVSKYRPPVPQAQANFGQYGVAVPSLAVKAEELVTQAVEAAKQQKLYAGGAVAVIQGADESNGDEKPLFRVLDG